MEFVSQTISISEKHFTHVNRIIIDHHNFFTLSSKSDIIIHKCHIQNWGFQATKIYYMVIQKYIYTPVSKPEVEEGADHGSMAR